MRQVKKFPPNPQHFAISAGLKIMVVPCLYWLAVFSATLFEKPVFVRWLILADNPIAQTMMIMAMVVLPVIVLLINIKTRYERRVPEAVRSPLANKLQVIVMGMALLSLAGAFSYSFFQRLDFWLFISRS